MAETSYIIQNGKRLNLKDASARSSIGSCSELKTKTQHCLVYAINELVDKFSEDIIVENGSVVSKSLFGSETALNPANITITDESGKVTLSTEGLFFEDILGNQKTIGGIGYALEADQAVPFGQMEEYVLEAIPDIPEITVDETLTYENGKLSVNTADEVGDNTLPITAAAVNTTVGNIEVLLKTI